MSHAQKYLADLAKQCHYSDEGGFDAEGNDLGSVDSLIEYKNALEDAFAGLLNGLTDAIELDDADEEGILPGSAADQCAGVYALLGRYGVTIR